MAFYKMYQKLFQNNCLWNSKFMFCVSIWLLHGGLMVAAIFAFSFLSIYIILLLGKSLYLNLISFILSFFSILIKMFFVWTAFFHESINQKHKVLKFRLKLLHLFFFAGCHFVGKFKKKRWFLVFDEKSSVIL